MKISKYLLNALLATTIMDQGFAAEPPFMPTSPTVSKAPHDPNFKSKKVLDLESLYNDLLTQYVNKEDIEIHSEKIDKIEQILAGTPSEKRQATKAERLIIFKAIISKVLYCGRIEKIDASKVNPRFKQHFDIINNAIVIANGQLMMNKKTQSPMIHGNLNLGPKVDGMTGSELFLQAYDQVIREHTLTARGTAAVALSLPVKKSKSVVLDGF